MGAHLSGMMPSSLTGNPALTVIVAAKSNASIGTKRLIQFGSSAGAAKQVLGFSENGSFEYNSGTLSFASTPSFGSSTHVAVFRRDKDSLNRKGEFFMDGAKLSLAGVASGSITLPSSGGVMTVAAGKMSNGSMSAFEGEIYEIMVASKSLNDFAIRRLEDISPINGEEKSIWPAHIISRQIVRYSEDRSRYIKRQIQQFMVCRSTVCPVFL